MSEKGNRSAAEQAAKSGNDLGRLLVMLSLLGCLGLGIAWWLYMSRLGAPEQDAAVWGQLGDFIGGVTNPVLSFLGLIALLMTVRLQADQLSAVREEQQQAREAQHAAAEALRLQIAQAEALVAAQLRTAQAQEAAAEALRDQLVAAREAAHEQLEHTRALVQAQHASTAAQHRAAEEQQRSAQAMERAAGAQEFSATKVAEQLALAKSTANVQKRAADAQLAPALFAVARAVHDQGGAKGDDVQAMNQSKDAMVSLLMASVRAALADEGGGKA